MSPTIIAEIASKRGIDEKAVVGVVAEFALQLHRHALEYSSGNGDFIGEDLWCQVDPQTYFHLLGFLEYFANHYGWEPGSASEYLGCLGVNCGQFNEQMKGWRLPPPFGKAPGHS